VGGSGAVSLLIEITDSGNILSFSRPSRMVGNTKATAFRCWSDITVARVESFVLHDWTRTVSSDSERELERDATLKPVLLSRNRSDGSVS
jgi:hypothetical protein